MMMDIHCHHNPGGRNKPAGVHRFVWREQGDERVRLCKFCLKTPDELNRRHDELMIFGEVPNTTRPRGVDVELLDIIDVRGCRYGLAHDRAGQGWLMTTVGGAWRVTAETLINGTTEPPSAVYGARTGIVVDLADYIVTYNDRLDSTHAALFEQFTTEGKRS